MSGHMITAQAHPNIAFIKYWGKLRIKIKCFRKHFYS